MKVAGKERPILFSTPMVKAIMDGTKTQTRRIVKPQPSSKVEWDKFGMSGLTPEGCIEGRGLFPDGQGYGSKFFKSKYGIVNDILWVRETWRPKWWDEDGELVIEFKAGGEKRMDVTMYDIESFLSSIQKEIETKGVYIDTDGHTHPVNEFRWRPSIHIPKDYTRFRLTIEAVGIEKLLDISDEDAIAEGIERKTTEDGKTLYKIYPCKESVKLDCHVHKSSDDEAESGLLTESPRESFFSLWDSIHGKNTHKENPYLWVVKFKI